MALVLVAGHQQQQQRRHHQQQQQRHLLQPLGLQQLRQENNMIMIASNSLHDMHNSSNQPPKSTCSQNTLPSEGRCATSNDGHRHDDDEHDAGEDQLQHLSMIAPKATRIIREHDIQLSGTSSSNGLDNKKLSGSTSSSNGRINKIGRSNLKSDSGDLGAHTTTGSGDDLELIKNQRWLPASMPTVIVVKQRTEESDEPSSTTSFLDCIPSPTPTASAVVASPAGVANTADDDDDVGNDADAENSITSSVQLKDSNRIQSSHNTVTNNSSGGGGGGSSGNVYKKDCTPSLPTRSSSNFSDAVKEEDEEADSSGESSSSSSNEEGTKQRRNSSSIAKSSGDVPPPPPPSTTRYSPGISCKAVAGSHEERRHHRPMKNVTCVSPVTEDKPKITKPETVARAAAPDVNSSSSDTTSRSPPSSLKLREHFKNSKQNEDNSATLWQHGRPNNMYKINSGSSSGGSNHSSSSNNNNNSGRRLQHQHHHQKQAPSQRHQHQQQRSSLVYNTRNSIALSSLSSVSAMTSSSSLSSKMLSSCGSIRRIYYDNNLNNSGHDPTSNTSGGGSGGDHHSHNHHHPSSNRRTSGRWNNGGSTSGGSSSNGHHGSGTGTGAGAISRRSSIRLSMLRRTRQSFLSTSSYGTSFSSLTSCSDITMGSSLGRMQSSSSSSRSSISRTSSGSDLGRSSIYVDVDDLYFATVLEEDNEE